MGNRGNFTQNPGVIILKICSKLKYGRVGVWQTGAPFALKLRISLKPFGLKNFWGLGAIKKF